MIFYNYIGFLTLIKRETRRYTKVYVQTLLAPLFSNLLFLGIFGTALKDRVVGLEGIDYLSFMMPGLCIMGAILGAFSNPSSSIIIQKYNGTIQDLNTYPMSNTEKTLAYIISGTLRGVLVGIATLIAGLPFLGWQMSSIPLFLLILVLSSMFFASFGLIAGLLAKTFDYISFFITFIITPLSYFGGVFFEISSLPSFVQKFAVLNPVVPMISTIRYSYLGVGGSNILLNIVIILMSVLALFILSNHLMHKGVGLVTK